jgi:hypothetical protein
MLYPKGYPAKRKRATLESDPPRDNRMGVTDIRQGEYPCSPTHPTQDIQSPPMPCKLRGFGGRAPDSKRTFSLSI